jgi:hypothetical protein
MPFYLAFNSPSLVNSSSEMVLVAKKQSGASTILVNCHVYENLQMLLELK